MKKSLIVLCLISGIVVSAQTDFKNLSNKKGLDFLNNLNLHIVSLVPTVKNYKNFKEQIKNIPLKYYRNIDSIEYSKYNKKKSIITIYAQERSFKSENSFEVRQKRKTDSLLLTNIILNMELKDNIISYEKYRNSKFSYKIVEKKIAKNKKRIVFVRTSKEI